MQKVPGSHRDLLKAQFATLATVGASGRPQQSVVWFLAEGDDIGISLSNSRQKTANLQRNPTCSLLILDPTNSFRYLEVRGQAIILSKEPGWKKLRGAGADRDLMSAFAAHRRSEREREDAGS